MNYLGIRLIGTSFLCCVLFCVDPAGSGGLSAPAHGAGPELTSSRSLTAPASQEPCCLCPPAVGTSWVLGGFPVALSCLEAALGPPRPPLPSRLPPTSALQAPCALPPALFCACAPNSEAQTTCPSAHLSLLQLRSRSPGSSRAERRVRWGSGAALMLSQRVSDGCFRV